MKVISENDDDAGKAEDVEGAEDENKMKMEMNRRNSRRKRGGNEDRTDGL